MRSHGTMHIPRYSGKLRENIPIVAVKPIRKAVTFERKSSSSSDSLTGILSDRRSSGKKKVSEKQLRKDPNKAHLFEVYDPLAGTPSIPFWNSFLTYFGVLLVLQFFGALQDWLRKRRKTPRAGEPVQSDDTKEFPSLYQSYEGFVIRNIYSRVKGCFETPICSVPGGRVDLVVRKSLCQTYKLKYHYPGTIDANKLNLASYNYLGFADAYGACADSSVETVTTDSINATSSEQELGRMQIHDDLEKLTAKFLDVEDCMVFGMGFATNSMNIPVLVNHKSLIISDQRNHASIVTGCRLSGATIRPFRHNDMDHLEDVLKEAVLHGNPKRHFRPWDKILIIVEGVYSMEGTICDLRRCIELKKKYHAYLYLDEAHSIGAMGDTGRGVCEYWHVKHSDVDVLMGTFTKSFGAAGGYIAGSRELVAHLRNFNHGSIYAPTMSPPVAAQALTALKKIGWSSDGHARINQLAVNSKYFRNALIERGFVVFGDNNSPVVPVLMCEIGKLERFQQSLIQQGLATVIVGFPATHMCENRARFCLSSAHSLEDLRKAVEIIKLVGDEVGVTYLK